MTHAADCNSAFVQPSSRLSNRLYELDRATVALPRARFLSFQNLQRFFAIFHPNWMVIARQALIAPDTWNPIYNSAIEKAGYQLVFSNRAYWVYRQEAGR